jgi:N-acetylneuraminate synthase
MQKKDVENFYTEEKLSSEYKSPYGKTYRDYRTIFEFGKREFDIFDERCDELGVQWFATPQDVKSLKFLLEYDMPLVKVASTNSRNSQLMSEIKKQVPKDKKLVISIGGCELGDVEEIVKSFDNYQLVIQHCVSEYPVPEERLGLGNIPVMKEKFSSDNISIGYSGHERGIAPSLAAIDMGAQLVERHFCLSRHSFVHHIKPSLEPNEFKQLTAIAEKENEYSKYYEGLPEESFQTNFGMTDIEEKFLEENTYSDEFLGEKSEI